MARPERRRRPRLLSLLACALPLALADDTVTFGVIGNWGGTGTAPYTTLGQLQAAAGFEAIAADTAMSFVLSTGGNFLPSGLPVGTETSPQTTARFAATWSDVYNGPALANTPWYLIGSYADWQGNITAERGFTTGVASRWQFPNLWHTFTVNVPPTYNTLQIVMVDTVTLTGDMLNDPFPAPPGGWAPPPPPLAPFAASDLSDTRDVDTGTGAAPEAARRRLAGAGRGRGGGRRLSDFNTKHNPPVSSAQWEWLNHVLNTSTAEWLIVVGSDPVWSAGEHGPTWALVERLTPLLQAHGVALYLSGREPMLQHFSGGAEAPAVDFVGSGAGAAANATAARLLPSLSLCPAGSLQYAYGNGTGFVTVGLTPGGGLTGSKAGLMTVSFFDASGGLLYKFSKENQRTPPNFQHEDTAATAAPGSGVTQIAGTLFLFIGLGCLYFVYLTLAPPPPAPKAKAAKAAKVKSTERTPLLAATKNEWTSAL